VRSNGGKKREEGEGRRAKERVVIRRAARLDQIVKSGNRRHSYMHTHVCKLELLTQKLTLLRTQGALKSASCSTHTDNIHSNTTRGWLIGQRGRNLFKRSLDSREDGKQIKTCSKCYIRFTLKWIRIKWMLSKWKEFSPSLSFGDEARRPHFPVRDLSFVKEV
jgi:hypothetical protein